MKTNRTKLSAMVKLGQRGALLASALCLGGMAQAQTTYNVAGLADFIDRHGSSRFSSRSRNSVRR